VTTSHAATVRFCWRQVERGVAYGHEGSDKGIGVPDIYGERLANQTYCVDKKDRLFADSRLVRFEDAKLNPTATFRALAEFLDLPYTESMTRCDSAMGFKTDAVYRTYDEFSDIHERTLMEYLLRDIYRAYGYGFHYYDGKPMEEAEAEALAGKCSENLDRSRRAYWISRDRFEKTTSLHGDMLDQKINETIDKEFARRSKRLSLMVRIFQKNAEFYSPEGRKLELMEQLKLDPTLLEQPLYH